MKLLVAYASTQGQTRAIAHHVMDVLFAAGHSVALMPLADAKGVDLERFDGAVLGASLHASHYQKDLAEFVASEPAALDVFPTLFLSVSLAAAGHEVEDWKTLERITDDMSEATGWTPGEIAHVAGAYTPDKYDVVTRFIMRRIVAAKDPGANLDEEIVYTDWRALDTTLENWLAKVSG